MEISKSIHRSIQRLYRQNQRFSLSRTIHPDLTPSEFQLLRHVGFHGEVSQRHLADIMGVDKAMVSRTLQKLEENGYLIRKEDERDARLKRVIALPPALEIHTEGKELAEQFYDAITSEFSEEEIELLDQMLQKMVKTARAINHTGMEQTTKEEKSL